MDSVVVKGKPLSKDETKALVELIEKSKIITTKTTNASNNKLKTQEWIRLTDKFNATSTSCRRTPQQLRLKWENLKKNTRKRNTRIRMNNIQIMPHPLVESGRASGEPFRPQHLVIDFQPQPGDNEETGLKCSQFWEAVHKHPDLEGMVVLPENDKKFMKQSSQVPVHRNFAAPNKNYSNCPALDIFQNLEEKGGVLNAAFATNSSKAKCHK